MSKERECAEKLRAIIGKEPFATYLAKVDSVDSDEASCTVERIFDGMVIENVKLNATITKNEGIVIAPKQDSHVLITSIDGLNWFVSQYSAIDGITIDSESPIIFNGGNNEGLIKIEKLTQKLNELVDAFNQHTHIGSFSGTIAPSTPVSGTINATSIPIPITQPFFVKSDYEDPNVTH